jgi:hypothetical protein
MRKGFRSEQATDSGQVTSRRVGKGFRTEN